MRARLLTLPFLLAAFGIGLFVTTGQPLEAEKNKAADFAEVSSYYKKTERKPSLAMRTRGIFRLASSRDYRVLDILKSRYESKREQDPAYAVRYVIADAVGRYLQIEDFTKDLHKWAWKAKKPDDSWLQYNCLTNIASFADEDTFHDWAMKKSVKPFARAAALEAYGQYGSHPELLPLAVNTALNEKLPKANKDKSIAERRAIVESCASALCFYIRAEPSRRKTEVCQKAIKSLINQLGDEDCNADSRLVIARYLARMYGRKRIDITMPHWLKVMDDDMKGEKGGEDRKGGRTRSKFVGIEGHGTRIAFVIDFSSSMKEYVSRGDGKWREVGTDEEDEYEEEESKPSEEKEGTKKEKDPAEELDWSKIKTRLDLAKAYLRVALKQLDPEVHFSVIAFHDKAEFLPGYTGLMKASEGNISGVLSALDSYNPYEIDKKRPAYDPDDGVRGTNIHHGLLTAFRSVAAEPKKGKFPDKPGAVVDGEEHCNPAVMTRGVDTIFLLSDGEPSCCTYAGPDTAIEESGSTGKENQAQDKKINEGDSIYTWGPYSVPYSLLRDVQRMNLFRKVEIHCVGMGEAEEAFLVELARLGMGRVRMLGE